MSNIGYSFLENFETDPNCTPSAEVCVPASSKAKSGGWSGGSAPGHPANKAGGGGGSSSGSPGSSDENNPICTNNPPGSAPYHAPGSGGEQPSVPPHVPPATGPAAQCNPNIHPNMPTGPAHLKPIGHPGFTQAICVPAAAPGSDQDTGSTSGITGGSLPNTMPPNPHAKGDVHNDSIQKQSTCSWKRICSPSDDSGSVFSESSGDSGDSPPPSPPSTQAPPSTHAPPATPTPPAPAHHMASGGSNQVCSYNSLPACSVYSGGSAGQHTPVYDSSIPVHHNTYSHHTVAPKPLHMSTPCPACPTCTPCPRNLVKHANMHLDLKKHQQESNKKYNIKQQGNSGSKDCPACPTTSPQTAADLQKQAHEKIQTKARQQCILNAASCIQSQGGAGSGGGGSCTVMPNMTCTTNGGNGGNGSGNCYT